MSDTIPMRPFLVKSPRVRQMVASLRGSQAFTAWAAGPGKATGEVLARFTAWTLMEVWHVARSLASRGVLARADMAHVDALAGVPGFAEAMREAGWLEVRTDGLAFPNFEEHNPPPAPEAQAKPARGGGRPARKPPAAPGAEEGFARFWAAYPRKIGHGAARKAWDKLATSDALVETILAAVERQSRCQQWLKDGGQFIPRASTWLNESRWKDDPGNAEGTRERITRTGEQMRRRREGEVKLPADDIKAILERARKKEGEL